jgi:RNA polymerase sigma-70 factor (ECF subfamily)
MPTQTRATRIYSRFKIAGSRIDDRAESVQALDAHAGLIIASAARVLGNLADAEDVAQDIAEKLLKSPPTQVRSWPAYLKTMAVNGALDRLRRRKDWTDLDPLQATSDPETALHDEQRADILRGAIGRLPERDGQLFALYYFGDLTHADIAARMNMTTNAVGVSLHRLRTRLTSDVRAVLDSTEGDIEK